MKYISISIIYISICVLCPEAKALEIKLTETNSVSSTSTESLMYSSDSFRYRELMKGLRGKVSPNIDQLTALGIEDRNDAEL